MPLFNKKYIRKQVGEHLAPIPDDHLKILSDWATSIKDGSIKTQKETALHGTFKSKIVENILGYRDFTFGDEWTVAAEEKIGKGGVDLALGTFTKDSSNIIAPFELKGAKTHDLDAIMPGRNKSPVQQAWEYANGVQGCGWVLVCNYVELRVYSYGTGNQDYEKFLFVDLTDPVEYARFQLVLNADNLLTGTTQNHLDASHLEDKDITNSLYKDYREIRHVLIDEVQKAAPEADGETQIAYAQTILDRVLFIAFAEDTGLLPTDSLKNAFEHNDPYKSKPVWETFKGLFSAIDKGSKELGILRYNGGLFKRYPAIDKLKLPNLVCEGFKNLGEYDFASEISVTILGHIFEQSITDLERLQAIARGEEVEPEKKIGTTGKRKLGGVVYTPDYIARFIVEQTLGTHLKELFQDGLTKHVKKASRNNAYEDLQWRSKDSELKCWTDYQKRIGQLRIVDPACGSGVFLVTAFDYLKGEYHRVNAKVADLSGAQPGLFDPDSEILSKNLFGVDVNAESVEITKLSLWLKTARKGKVLDSLDDHLRVGDSLIEDANYAYLDHGFSWKEAFPSIIKEGGGFDIVLGNPPYVRMELIKPMKPYLEKRFEVVSDRADLYCYFYERGLKLLKEGGRLGYISSSTFFKTGSGKPLRQYLASNASLETIVDFGDHQIFEGVTTYPVIMVMQAKKPPKGHQITFWEIDNMPESNFSNAFDEQKAIYTQNKLSETPWELENERLAALRIKITKGKNTLKKEYGAPFYGIKTGYNDAFVINQKTHDKLISSDPKSIELLRPFLEGKDLKRWHSESRKLWIIYIPKNKIDIDNYPAVKSHLNPHKDRLENRATKQEWFELQQAQLAYAPSFEAIKISYPHFSKSRLFHLEQKGSYSNDKSYLIPSSDLFLLGLLNSSLMWFIITALAPAVRGGYHELRVQYMETLPIPKATEKQKNELTALSIFCQSTAEKRYEMQQAFTRRIPDLCSDDQEVKLTSKMKNWWEFEDFSTFRKEVKKIFKQDIPLADRTDWEDWIAKDKAEINRLSAEINAGEDKINALVYTLFDLTKDEIKLLEANI